MTLIHGLAEVLKIVSTGKQGWVLIFCMSLVPLVLGQAHKMTAISSHDVLNNIGKMTFLDMDIRKR